jgi:tellurite resistance protein TehA-like permease
MTCIWIIAVIVTVAFVTLLVVSVWRFIEFVWELSRGDIELDPIALAFSVIFGLCVGLTNFAVTQWLLQTALKP